MGQIASSMVHIAVQALTQRDEGRCQEVRKKEQDVDNLQVELDDRAVKLTALNQPVGADLRFLFMVSRISTEIERIADQAVNICETTPTLLKEPLLKPLIDFPLMAETAEKMVTDSLEALVRRDVALANRVLGEQEAKVDALRDQIFRELLTYMMSDPATIPRALALILISRNLERVGDHATNIAEEVIYLVQGRDVRHQHGDAP
jgi:phosphate transport system protein